MKNILLSAALLIVSISLNAQCPQSLNLTTQAEVDNFPVEYPNCTGFNNVIILNGLDITDLTPLSSITFLEALFISNTGLTSLTGLENLINVGVLNIINNDVLVDISALNSTVLSGITIEDNAMLSECNALSVCEHLINDGNSNISNNGLGCNSSEEVITSCLGDFNLLTGTINFDFNNNGCSEFDIEANNLQVAAFNGVDQIITTTDENGVYAFIFDWEGDVTTQLISASLPDFYEATPEMEIVNFVGTGSQETIDFCLTTTTLIDDVKVTFIPINDARPGFESDYLIVYENLGTTIQSGEIILIYEDGRQEYNNSSELPAETNLGEVKWDYNNLLPFQSRSITVTLFNFEPPTNEDGDILVLETSILPLNDDFPNNNFYTLEQIMVNSQDPNDKLVLQGSEIEESQVGDFLDYIVRFENIGTVDAINVRVDDVLSNQLDVSSFRIIDSSHDYRVEITNNNELSFIFDNINLPPIDTNPVTGLGYVAFQIRTNDNLQLGDVIENTANIVFDFNAPIITNTVTTTVVPPLGVSEFNIASQVILFPNPVSEILTIETKNSLLYNSAKVLSILGEDILETSNNEINVSQLSSGVYFIEISTNEGSVTKKIVKE